MKRPRRRHDPWYIERFCQSPMVRAVAVLLALFMGVVLVLCFGCGGPDAGQIPNQAPPPPTSWRNSDDVGARRAIPDEPNEHKQVSTEIWEGHYRALVNWDYHNTMRLEFRTSGESDREKLHDWLRGRWRELEKDWRWLRSVRKRYSASTLRIVCDRLNEKRAEIEQDEPVYAYDKQKMREAQQRVNELLDCKSVAAPEPTPAEPAGEMSVLVREGE